MPVHCRSLISNFVIHLLEIIMSILAMSKHSTVHLARVPDILSWVYIGITLMLSYPGCHVGSFHLLYCNLLHRLLVIILHALLTTQRKK